MACADSTSFSPMPFHVMAKPNGPLCNLDCKYCYYLEKEALFPDTSQFRMPEDVLRRFIREYIASQDVFGMNEIMFSWQGGEPTLAGLDYFRHIVELQKNYCPKGKRIINALQTNGILIDEQWADFLKEHDFLVGLSIDGPAELHDTYRVNKAGRPSFDKVMAAAQLLLERGVKLNALTTVNRTNSQKPREVYRFLKSAGFEFIQFIPIVERSVDGEHLAGAPQQDEEGIDAHVTPWSVLPRDYGRFLCSVFDEWVKEDVGRISVQLFDVQLGLLLGQPAALCWFAETCGWGLAMEHNGNLYSCDHYVYPQYLLGNILQKPLTELAYSKEQQTFGADKHTTLPQDCLSCKLRYLCQGGCPKHRILKPRSGSGGLNYYCRSFKMFYEHAAPYLHFIADQYRRGLSDPEINQVLRQNHTKIKLQASGTRSIGRNDPCPCGSGKKFKNCCNGKR